jgi:hypothetical protein
MLKILIIATVLLPTLATHRYAFRAQQTPFDQQTVQYSNDKDFLEKLFGRVLRVMTVQARRPKALNRVLTGAPD